MVAVSGFTTILGRLAVLCQGAAILWTGACPAFVGNNDRYSLQEPFHGFAFKPTYVKQPVDVQ